MLLTFDEAVHVHILGHDVIGMRHISSGPDLQAESGLSSQPVSSFAKMTCLCADYTYRSCLELADTAQVSFATTICVL